MGAAKPRRPPGSPAPRVPAGVFRRCRAARTRGTGRRGAITSPTLFVKVNDLSDPIADSVRGSSTSHRTLAPLATAGTFPAVDVLASISRLAPEILSPSDLQLTAHLRGLMAAYDEAKELIQLGAYVTGSDPRVEAAKAALPEINAFLRQRVDERAGIAETFARLRGVVAKKPGK